MRPTFWRFWPARQARVIVLVLGLATAILMAGCDPGADVTYVNDTATTVVVYLGDDLEKREAVIPPHSSDTGLTIDAVWEDVIVVRDEQGEVLLRQELTWDELEAQDFRFVIDENSLVPTPTESPPER